jgi:hypothetical protein
VQHRPFDKERTQKTEKEEEEARSRHERGEHWKKSIESLFDDAGPEGISV